MTTEQNSADHDFPNEEYDEEYEREEREMLKIEAENGLGNAWQEHKAGEPGHHFLTPEEQDAAADRFFAEARRQLGLDPLPAEAKSEEDRIRGAAVLRTHSIRGAAILRSHSNGPIDIEIDAAPQKGTGAER